MHRYPHPDDGEDRTATPDEAIREYALIAGREQPERAWLLTDYDSWVRNPVYVGPPVRHPEDDGEDPPSIAEQIAACEEALANLHCTCTSVADVCEDCALRRLYRDALRQLTTQHAGAAVTPRHDPAPDGWDDSIPF
jgi:hypothetical protein